MNEYLEFLGTKQIIHKNNGFEISRDVLHHQLFDFQKDIVKWNLLKGKSADFTMTGTGKTLMQCEWAKHIYNHTKDSVLIVAPLAVSHQTITEAKKIDLIVNWCSSQSDVKPGINITNYEKIHKFNPKTFGGIVLDESSILKSYSGKYRTELITMFNKTPFKLCCSATPAPNDYMELGNHAEFLNIMKRTEMLSIFFTHSGSDTSKWFIKGHAEYDYWKWLASWAVLLTMPGDLGYDNDGFVLPRLNIQEHIIKSNGHYTGTLFDFEGQTLNERRKARKESIEPRCKFAADIVNNSNEIYLVWCGLNSESEMLHKLIPGSVEVKGADSEEHKEKSLMDFALGKIRVLVTKASIAGFGMNWQVCHNMAFVGLSDSFEQYFQAVRRCWRFGQKHPVNVDIITSNRENSVLSNIKRKESDFNNMIMNLLEHTKNITKENIRDIKQKESKYNPQITMEIPEWI